MLARSTALLTAAGDMEPEGALAPDATGYQIEDLILDLGQRCVTRDGSDIALPQLSFDLLVTLAQTAPNFVSFDQLSERVWPRLVIAPEAISQRGRRGFRTEGSASQ